MDEKPSGAPTPEDPPRESSDLVTCPICGGRGTERKEKWFCAECGQLLQTCCD